MSTHFIGCSEIWGGVRGEDLEACTSAIDASLYCSSAEGGKGGDVYYFSVCSSDIVTRIALADVVGHGETVSHISQWLYESLRSHMESLNGNDVLSELNSQASNRGREALSTAAVVSIHRENRQLYFSYAGHHPMYAWHKSGGKWQPVVLVSSQGQSNLPLGVFPQVTYDQEFREVASGDRLFLYTDGVIDAPDAREDSFGKSRLLAILDSAGKDSLNSLKSAVLEALRKHTGGPMIHDDVTFMAVEIR